MAKVAVIGIPGKWSSEALADEIEQRSGFRLLVDMAQVSLDLAERRLLYQGTDLCQLDGLVVKKISPRYSPNTLDRLELLRMAEVAGVRVFSPAERILRLVDRLSCTLTLGSQGIPMPATLITEDEDAAQQAIDRFGSAVFKPLYSTKARGMRLIHAKDNDRKAAVREFKRLNPMMYIQQRLKLPGRDLGMLFLGGRYLGSYARVGQNGSWNTTINSGGRYARAEPEAELIDLAQRAQDLFGMDFTTVDLAETEQGPVIFEVSAFGGFRGAQEGLGINAAAAYAEHVLGLL
ncbi:GAK system ATP-grasp enzyme [Magnetovirga frankeli]|uniref:GAK system ATP-grasp enzyme n=1 Tax=Magnetovirga frankeli TaxID=947516 RepID=UPI0012936E95|nr:GAK system ATP-grasp enzyme [gamma proteobacterium SS-5]